MKEAHIHFDYKARYYTLGELNDKTEQIWFVLHGYGQLAKYFISKFKNLDDRKHLIVAPEGLSRFYLHGFSGRIGATWMTKEDRLSDIDNYKSYLNVLYDSFTSELNPHVKINFLGFSQGAATISRWALGCDRHFDRLILWAGIFPPDLNFEIGSKILAKKEVNFIYGSQDEYLSERVLTEHGRLKEKLNITSQDICFQGGHDIDSEILLSLA